MKKAIIILASMLIHYSVFAQSWGQADSCHVNVNDPAYQNFGRIGIISSTVKINLDGDECSGTLINRNTTDEELGFYILTAKHCIDGLDFSVVHKLYFNYQSPDALNNSTYPTNQGKNFWQSTLSVNDGHEYLHESQLELIADFTWGDLALLKVLTPLPPHFNVTYAGWNPNRFYNGVLSGVPGYPVLPSQYAAIHHPRGDIKKISGVNSILWLETPIATGCYTITTIIDVLFGWIWGNTVSTSVICNYVDNPWMTVPTFQYGIVEDGSSGYGIFNTDDKNFGVLSGSLSTCNNPLIATYGKLHANYSKSSIKNTVNPNHNVWVDLFGMDDRKITCYEDLILPGETGVSGEYFPADHYQYYNKIVLQASNDISTDDPINIHPDADYEFVAGNKITLSPGFYAASGSNFVARIGACNSQKATTSNMDQFLISKVRENKLPFSKPFEIGKYEPVAQNFEVLIVPNPNKGTFKIESKNQGEELNSVEIINTLGQKVYSDLEIHRSKVAVDISTQPNGIYFVKISTGNQIYNKQIIVQ